jgi:hypothetical protein
MTLIMCRGFCVANTIKSRKNMYIFFLVMCTTKIRVHYVHRYIHPIVGKVGTYICISEYVHRDINQFFICDVKKLEGTHDISMWPQTRVARFFLTQYSKTVENCH